MSILRSTIHLLSSLLAVAFGVAILWSARELGASGAAANADIGFVLACVSGCGGVLAGLTLFGWLAYGVARERHGWVAVLISGLVAAIVAGGYFLVPASDPMPFVYCGEC